MRIRSATLFCFAAAVLFLSACSSPTVVVSEDRPDADQASDASSEPESSSESADSVVTGDADANNAEASDANTSDDEEASANSDAPRTPRQLEEAEGFGLGGAEQLGGLSDDCVAGSDQACDILFQLSGFDSDEEATALTCGGRSDAEQSFCTSGIDTLPDQLVFDPDSAGLAAIVDSCTDGGDMTACDFLYFRSPAGSDIEEVGATCGDRVSVAVPDCRTFLAE